MSFAPDVTYDGSRRIRSAQFIERSMLPASAACLVAGGVREALSALVGSSVQVRVTEPMLPSAQAWLAIVRDATIYRVPGRVADAAILVRSRDALAMAGSAFGEPAGDPRPLSPIERTVLERAMGALAAHVATLCGSRDGVATLQPVRELVGFATYFELLVEGPSDYRIAIALSRDPQPLPGAHLRIEDLGEIEVEVTVHMNVAPIGPQALLELEPGAFLPMMKPTAPFDAAARLAGWPLAYGEGGVSGARYAFVLDEREPAPMRSL
ncbi:MAG: FliM/FliN family flagellar motor switch protein [Vulcanimicrobiaceae bacterium]